MPRNWISPTARVWSLRFDFNGPSNDTAAAPAGQQGFIGVRGSQTYADTPGYGWDQTVAELERPVTATYNVVTTKSFYRDGAMGLMGASGQRSFQLHVPASSTGYNVRVYLGDQGYYRDYVQISVEGVAGYKVVSTSANEFKTAEFAGGYDVDGDGKLWIKIGDQGGSDRYWVVNGIDLWTGPR